MQLLIRFVKVWRQIWRTDHQGSGYGLQRSDLALEWKSGQGKVGFLWGAVTGICHVNFSPLKAQKFDPYCIASMWVWQLFDQECICFCIRAYQLHGTPALCHCQKSRNVFPGTVDARSIVTYVEGYGCCRTRKSQITADLPSSSHIFVAHTFACLVMTRISSPDYLCILCEAAPSPKCHVFHTPEIYFHSIITKCVIIWKLKDESGVLCRKRLFPAKVTRNFSLSCDLCEWDLVYYLIHP